MPGPVSDSYDPEFGTGSNAEDVRDALDVLRDRIGIILGPGLKDIVQVAQGPAGPKQRMSWSERDLRLIRFAINCCIEDRL